MKNKLKKILAVCMSISVMTALSYQAFAEVDYDYAGNDILYEYDFDSMEQPFTNANGVASLEPADGIHGGALKIVSKDSASVGWTYAEGFAPEGNTTLLSMDIKVASDTKSFCLQLQDENKKKLVKFYVRSGDKSLVLSNDTSTSSALGYTKDQWYTVDIILDFSSHTAYFYVDGAEKGSCGMAYTTGTRLGYVYAGAENVDITGGALASEFYIDNMRLSNDLQVQDVYADARLSEQDPRTACLTFSETPTKEARESILNSSKTKLYNINTGDAIELEEIKLCGRTLTLTAKQALSGGDYAISIPGGIQSVTEKICYTYLFYFSVEDYDVKFAIDYDDENVNPYPNETVEFRASAASEGIPAANYSVVNTGDTDHSKALEFASVAAANDTYIRYYPVEAEGETRFTTLSFDVQLKQDNEFAFAIDVMGSEKAMYRSIFNGKNSFIAFRNPTTSPDLDYCILNDYTTSTDARLVSKFEKDKWYNIKVKFDKQNKKADVYFDNTLLGSYESENIGLIDRIVFYDYGVTNRADWDLKSGRRIWIDNLELKYFNEKDIESVRFNSNEEIYGPMSEKISPKSFTVTVKAAKDINRDEIADTIILKGANGDTINAQEYLYDAETKTITARFENLAPETEYILNVSGLKTASGTAISDYSAVFRTESVPDYGAEVLSGAKIVKNGNTAALSGQIKNQTRYTVSPVAILGEYCNEGLVQVVIQPLSINAWTEEYEIEGVFLNNVQDTSVVYGFIWNDIKNIKPFSGCERIE